MKSPNLYIIAGSNGAGKTSFARTFLPKYVKCPRFVNSDLLAAGLSPFAPELAARQAGRLVLTEITANIRQGLSFAFETTLSGRTQLRLIQEARRHDYLAHMFYLWLPTSELALLRIADRVTMGGHDVPEADVRRRLSRTVNNLFHLYRPLMDSLYFFDNSGARPHMVFRDLKGTCFVHDRPLYDRLMKEVGL